MGAERSWLSRPGPAPTIRDTRPNLSTPFGEDRRRISVDTLLGNRGKPSVATAPS
jgi:hypothetical protein